MESALLDCVEASDPSAALRAYRDDIEAGTAAWEIHRSLFPPAQRVLNPPFINPHFPKLHGICRELAERVAPADLAHLVRIEVGEFAYRPKLPLAAKGTPPAAVTFGDFEAAVARHAPSEAATVLAELWRREGGREVSRRLLLLGSGYLPKSLGHSVSCTAFIVLELLERPEQDPWPTLLAIADYFCQGDFNKAPAPDTWPDVGPYARRQDLLRAVSGGGIVNLHHTITLYAIERSRPVLDDASHRQLLAAWAAFLGDKESRPARLPGTGPATERGDFSSAFRTFVPNELAACCGGLIRTPDGRALLASHVVRALSECYRGKANPHHWTGLGSTLWVLDRFSGDPEIAEAALVQYLEYLLPEVKKELDRGPAFDLPQSS